MKGPLERCDKPVVVRQNSLKPMLSKISVARTANLFLFIFIQLPLNVKVAQIYYVTQSNKLITEFA